MGEFSTLNSKTKQVKTKLLPNTHFVSPFGNKIKYVELRGRSLQKLRENIEKQTLSFWRQAKTKGRRTTVGVMMMEGC